MRGALIRRHFKPTRSENNNALLPARDACAARIAAAASRPVSSALASLGGLRPLGHYAISRRRHAPPGRLSARRVATAVVLALLWGPAIHAQPWLPPGNLALRHDLQLLADAGILRSPITTWPMSWPDIARDALSAEPAAAARLDLATAGALARVQRLARAASAPGPSGLRLRAAGAESPAALRTFADTPREDGELTLGASWLGNRWAGNLQASVVADPTDGQELRLDGSYVGVSVANFMISFGAIERWWGPGWDGSLILSSNARPIPGLTIERNYSDPFAWALLRWLGPWRASIAVGQAEGSRVAVPDARFFAARLNFKPRPWLEFGLSRTAQWCGDGRPCDLGTFGKLLIGRDNRDASLGENDEPGNQMAGYDFRLRSPWRALPAAFYAQFIGEDEAGGLPSKFLGLLGAEVWGHLALGSYRLRLEYADTACSFMRSEPEFGCAYRNALYPQGYTYRGRIIGHALGADARTYSAGAVLVRPSGESWNVLVRSVESNRASTAAADLTNIELQYARGFSWGELSVGVGVDDHGGPARSGSDARAFIQWRQGL